jgi:hypothetical protein
MAFLFPDFIRKNTNLETLNEFELEYWHEKMHVFWARMESGTVIPEWDLRVVFDTHQKLIKLMKDKGVKHINPINSLDVVKEE